MTNIPQDQLERSLPYEGYRQLVDDLFAQGKVTGDEQSESLLQYTQLNIARMNRLDKTTRLTEETIEELAAVERPLRWLVLTEGWCGDAAQIVPVLYKMAQATDKIDFRLILRDEHPEIMDAFLTNGGRSIPKLIVLDSESGEVLGDWGPRPAEAQALVMEGKARSQAAATPNERIAIWNDTKKESQKWYARDKTRSIQREVLELVRALTSEKACCE